MPAKKHTYNTRHIKRDYPYNIQEVRDLFGIHKNTVRSWIKSGLKLMDKNRPHIVHGSDLIAYLNERQSKRKCKCKPHEFYCFKCRAARPTWKSIIDIDIKNTKLLQLSGVCASCSIKVFKAGSINKLPEYDKTFNIRLLLFY